jgi:general transcription factor 3C polypeptide 5 (transcription factor C subunit 1)
MLREMIEDDSDLREACDVRLFLLPVARNSQPFQERDGWFSTSSFEAIKTVLRHKYFSLLDGYVATDAECEALLVPEDDTGHVPIPHHQRKRRYGKHNMAKGALRPEDAAVSARPPTTYASANGC